MAMGAKVSLLKLISVAAVCVAGLWVAGWLPRSSQRRAITAQQAEGLVPSVLVTRPVMAKAEPGMLMPAEVRPAVEAPIYSRANGYLKAWHADIGARVESGALLAEIETPELDQELVRARADLEQVGAALGLAEVTAARWAELLKTSSVSEQEAAEKRADLGLKTAVVASARAGVRRLEELKGFARVVAPFEGTITVRRTDVGELVSAGSGRELFRLAQTTMLRVFVRVPQTLARSVQVGQSMEVLFSERRGKIVKVPIVRTAGVIDPASRTLLVEAELSNPSGEFLAGSYAQARLLGAKVEPVLTLPSNTLIFRPEGVSVGVVGIDEVVVLKRISLGRDFGPTVEILEGVGVDDVVVMNPSDSLSSGSRVRVQSASSRGGKPAK